MEGGGGLCEEGRGVRDSELGFCLLRFLGKRVYMSDSAETSRLLAKWPCKVF